jgi:pimeloyl-ACP methyl ester carboxylesterase
MKFRAGRIAFGAVVALALLLPAAAGAQPPIQSGPCVDGYLPHGAKSRICIPDVGWNGQLVLYAHGYVDVYQPKDFYHLDFGVVNLPDLVQSQGFAFATTTYRQNGLAILEGADDMLNLLTKFTTQHGAPLRTFIAGASEGGLVAALLLEQSPELFSSGLAACAPVGSFRGQVNYVGDFRVLFDYFFPDTIPGTVDNIPPDVVPNWVTVYVPKIIQKLEANQARALELMRTSGAAFDPANLDTIAQTTLNVLYYNVFGGTDAETKLGGNPFGNRLRWYSGSSNDLRLNLRVHRVSASPTALAVMTQYETTGRLTRPLVTLHTKGDEAIPFAHEPLYLLKVLLTGHSGLLPLPVARYGHCSFTPNELLTAFGLTVAAGAF